MYAYTLAFLREEVEKRISITTGYICQQKEIDQVNKELDGVQARMKREQKKFRKSKTCKVERDTASTPNW